MRKLTLGVCVGLWSAMAACGGSEPTGPAAVASVAVTPGVDTLDALGRTVQFNATVRDAAGNVLTGRAISWSSTTGAVATVNTGTGLVTAVANGSTMIRATVDGVIGSAQLVVMQAVASVTVTPGTAGLTSLGATQQFAAVARDGLNNPVVNPRFLWLSSDPAVATIDTLGRATARRAGAATITAAAEGIPGYAALNVTQATSQLAFRIQPPVTTVAGDAFATAVQVEVRDAGGALVADAQIPVTLTASTSTLKGTTTVNAINGVASFSGLFMEQSGVGYTITATSASLTQVVSSPYAITFAPAVAVAFASAPANDTAGSPLSIVARIRDRFGNTVTSATNEIRLRFHSAPVGGVLFGDSTISAVAGVATFATTNIHLAGSGYLLRAVASGLDSVASAPFTITHATAHHFAFPDVDLVFTVAPGFPAGGPRTVVRDVYQNLVTAGSYSMTLALVFSPWPPTGLAGITSYLTAGGEAVPDEWSIERTGLYQIIATGSGLVSDTFLLFSRIFITDALVAGGNTTCLQAGVALCTGANGFGQLGHAAVGTHDSVMIVAQGFPNGLANLTVGDAHACAVDPVGKCWGLNNQGQLGSGSAGPSGPTPVAVQGGITWRQLSAGSAHTCGISSDSTAYCWGDNASGQLGDDNAPNDRAFPAPVFRARKYIYVAAGASHTCAIAADSAAYCWGRGIEGQLGQSAFTTSDTAVLVTGALKFTAIKTGGVHTCGVVLAIAANVQCWGGDSFGQLGDGVVGPDRATPGLVTGGLTVNELTSRRTLSLGAQHSCALQSLGTGGSVMCWGGNGQGQLGQAVGPTSATPVVAMSGAQFSVAHVSVGAQHSCAYAPGAVSGGEAGLRCWGRNAEGQLGLGHTTSPVPTHQRAIQ